MMKNTRRLKNISYIFSVGKPRAILENEQIEKKIRVKDVRENGRLKNRNICHLIKAMGKKKAKTARVDFFWNTGN